MLEDHEVNRHTRKGVDGCTARIKETDTVYVAGNFYFNHGTEILDIKFEDSWENY